MIAFLTVELFFKLLNFFIIIGLLVYFFRRYAYPWAKEQIEHKKRIAQQLKEQKESLRTRLDELDQEVKKKLEYSQQSKVIIKDWNTKVRIALDHRLEEHKKIIQSLEKKKLEQARWLSRTKEQEKIVPAMLAQAEEELKAYFKSKGKADVFVNSITQFLKSKSV